MNPNPEPLVSKLRLLQAQQEIPSGFGFRVSRSAEPEHLSLKSTLDVFTGQVSRTIYAAVFPKTFALELRFEGSGFSRLRA